MIYQLLGLIITNKLTWAEPVEAIQELVDVDQVQRLGAPPDSLMSNISVYLLKLTPLL